MKISSCYWLITSHCAINDCHKWMKGEVIKVHLEYWKKKCLEAKADFNWNFLDYETDRDRYRGAREYGGQYMWSNYKLIIHNAIIIVVVKMIKYFV